MNIPDNYGRWELHDEEQEAWLNKRPLCSYCEEPIQEDYCYEIGGKLLCKDCMNDSYQVDTDTFIEDDY